MIEEKGENMTMELEKFVGELVNNFINREIARIKKDDPDRYKIITAEMVGKSRDWHTKKLLELWSKWHDLQEVDTYWHRGAFGPRNVMYRAIFERIYSVELPKTNRGTDEMIRGIIGDDRIRQYEQERAEQRRADAEAVEREEKEEHDRNIRRITAKLADDGEIGPEDFISIAREYGVKMHPRTVGTIRKRLRSISPSKVHFVGADLPYTIFRINNQIRSIAKEHERV